MSNESDNRWSKLFTSIERLRERWLGGAGDVGEASAPSLGAVDSDLGLPPLTETHDFGHWESVNMASWTWENFEPYELRSRGNGVVKLHIPTMNALQATRKLFGQPLVINSAYRDPAYNAKIGGAPRSQHKEGRAFDISARNMDATTRRQLVETAVKCGFTGFGGYNTFLHIDTGPARHWGQSWAMP